MSVFDNIKRISKKRGMNLQEVAIKAGLSKNIIYQYNKGKNPSLETLKKIANALEVTADTLLGKDTSKPSNPKHIDVEDIVNNSAELTSRNQALTDEDRAALRALVSTYLNSKEGQDRLRKFGGYDNKGNKIDKWCD